MAKPTNTDDQGVALSGYDPVSYFKSIPTKGEPGKTFEHNGATYQFANELNLNAFKSNPDAYAPKYGGYCATAMSEGTLFEVDPENYKIVGGDLYLFYKGEAGDTLPQWNEDEAARKANADKHWSEDTYKEHD